MTQDHERKMLRQQARRAALRRLAIAHEPEYLDLLWQEGLKRGVAVDLRTQSKPQWWRPRQAS